jgi:nucleotide-binding universal stress UspA family protein
MRIRRILAPTDFSRASLDAVDYAARLAREVEAEVAVLYVEDTTYALAEQLISSAAAVRVMQEAHGAARHQLALLGDRLHKSSLKVHTLILEGPAADRIVGAATKLRVDWIVLGTHGRTGPLRTFLGSVAERVVQQSPCPVLVIPKAPASGRRAARGR